MQHALKKVLYYRTFFNGDSGIRTHDLLNAIQALSQLSYTPMQSGTYFITDTAVCKVKIQILCKILSHIQD